MKGGLVLALYPTESGYDDFFVGDTRVSLYDVKSPTDFTVSVDNPGLASRFRVTDRRSTEIMPSVLVSAGKPSSSNRSVVRIVVDAPRHIKVLRGKLYRDSDGSSGN